MSNPHNTGQFSIQSVLKWYESHPPTAPLNQESRYELGPLLGEGGFGAVYRAQQISPIERPVALKRIEKRYEPSRLMGEVQALAQLDHPYIAKIFDAGKASEGQAFLAMELIEGFPITTYAYRERLSLEERLRLVSRVCQAITHAHQRGIIHRDLKPSNILVRERDGEAEPVVIDFGLAKAFHGWEALGGEEFETEAGMFLGTPEYVSPEQADPVVGSVDVRSDVYSLGVVLYQLVTGETPFSSEELRGRGLGEMQRILREFRPQRASDRLASLVEEDQRKLTESVRTDFAKHQKQVAGELDQILLKAMEKDPEHRYQSALALAEDIERLLADEPISISRPGVISSSHQIHPPPPRSSPGAKRNFSLSLIVGLVVSTYALLQVGARGEEARHEADKANRVLSFMREAFRTAAPDIRIGREITAAELLDRASEQLSSGLAEDPEIELELRLTVGGVYLDLGQALTARMIFERARELIGGFEGGRERVKERAQIGHSLGAALLKEGRLKESEAELLASLNMATDELGEEHPVTLTSLSILARLCEAQGRLAEAEPMHEKVLEVRRRVLGEEHPDTLTILSNLAALYKAQGRLAEAESLYEKTVEVMRRVQGEEHPNTLNSQNNLAALYLAQGRLGEAESLFKKAFQGRQRLFGNEHRNTLSSRYSLAKVLILRDKKDESRQLLAEGLEIARRVLGTKHRGTKAYEKALQSLEESKE